MQSLDGGGGRMRPDPPRSLNDSVIRTLCITVLCKYSFEIWPDHSQDASSGPELDIQH